MELRDALANRELRCEFKSEKPDRVTFTVANTGRAPVQISIPAGAIIAGADTDPRLILLKSATLSVAAGAEAEAILPACLLSSKLPAPMKPLRLATEPEPRLAALLNRLSTEADLPRATAQFAVFCLLEDMMFSGWQKFLAARRTASDEPHPTPAEVAQAIDVLGLVKEVAPKQTFALATDGELKLRALRNPWCRAKAMQLYGIQVTDDGAEFGLPNMSQLLHTKPGDNCPVCRSREEMKKGASDF